MKNEISFLFIVLRQPFKIQLIFFERQGPYNTAVYMSIIEHKLTINSRLQALYKQRLIYAASSVQVIYKLLTLSHKTSTIKS